MSNKLLVLACLAFLGTRAQVLAGGLSLGIEANSVFNQDMKLNAAPVLTRIETNNVTSLTTFRSMNYFNMVDYFPTKRNFTTSYTDDFAAGTTVTYNRGWDNLDWSGHYVMVKMGYSSEYIEGSAKIGAASKVLTRKEIEFYYSTNTQIANYAGEYPLPRSGNVSEGLAVAFDKGFAYGFELKGQPYDSENFSVMAAIRFDHAFNTVDDFKSVGIQYSTMGVMIGQYSGEGTTDISHLRYGMSLTAALKFEHFVPFIGIEWMDGRLRVVQRKLTSSTAYDATGKAVTSGISLIEELSYTLKPKVPVGGAIGITFPFERGGITLEGVMRSQNALKLSGYIGF